MFKTLLKKQLAELFAGFVKNKKTQKVKTQRTVILYALLFVFLFAFLGFTFFEFSKLLCEPLVSSGYGWMYFVFIGLLSLFLGVIGSVFNTYNSIYLAKDNDFLLSLPIPPKKILLARLLAVYILSLVYELIIYLPALIVYFIYAKLTVLGVIFGILAPFILSLFTLGLSCILGWLVALVSSKLKRKNIVTLVLSLAFIGAYFILYTQASTILQNVMSDLGASATAVKAWLFPLYQMGLAIEGDALAMLIFTSIMIAFMALIYILLSTSFLRLATAKNGAPTAKFKGNYAKESTLKGAILKKEFKRFVASPIYMLNCGLGLIFMVIATVLLIIYNGTLSELFTILDSALTADVSSLIAVAIICFMLTTVDISAPSVSLEGQSLWILQSLPVPAFEILLAKLKAHLALTAIPLIPLTVTVEIILKPSPICAILIPLCVILFDVLIAVVGLVLNLKMPNLSWTNEALPVKQSMPVFLTLFGGWVVVIGLGALYVLFNRFIAAWLYLLIICLIITAANALLLLWLKKRGTKILASL